MQSLILKAENVSKHFPEGQHQRSVLISANLEVYAGDITAIVGRSGSGKSTLLNCLGGLDTIDGGTIHIVGKDLAKLTEKQRTLLRRDTIGFVFQFFNLVPTLNVLENLLLPLELSKKLHAESKRKAIGLLEKVGLQDRLKSFPEILSGGEQQRLAIARALILDPPLILADEPTGNLDEDTAEHVMRLFTDLVHQQNKALVMVTHSADVIKQANRVLKMDHGKLISYTRDSASA